MTNYPTQLDEIDQWLFDSFGIVAGACSSIENLRHDTARMIAEALWPKSIEEDLEKASDEYATEVSLSGEVVQDYSGNYALYVKAKLPRNTKLKFGDKVIIDVHKDE